MQELESQFRGAGWNVVKTLWGSAWDELFALDTTGALVRRLREVPDAQVQTYQTRDAAYIREDFFGKDPALAEMAKLLSDDKIIECFHFSRGGHESRKVFAAYKAAVTFKGADGDPRADRQGPHPRQGLRVEERQPPDEEAVRRRVQGDARPPRAADPGQRLRRRPGALRPPGRRLPRGPLPPGAPRRPRRPRPGPPRPPGRAAAAPADKAFAAFDKGSGSQSGRHHHGVLVRLVKDLVRDKETGKRWVPIVPDEARTFGMESLFPSLGIYSPKGQTYEPVDRDQLMYYKEAENGQILNEGITEAGSMADFIAAATAYSTHGEAMIPFYIFYSMFGWQRTADQMWQLGDQLGRGFLVGATAGRTTLTGEGLQHADGHSSSPPPTRPR